TSQVSSGVSPEVIGLPAPMVLAKAREPSAFFTSQPQPEPKVPMETLLNSSLKASKEPKALLMASASSPVGSPPPLGLRQFQQKVWFHTWAALLNRPRLEVLMISSRLLPSCSVPAIRLFRLTTEVLWCLP